MTPKHCGRLGALAVAGCLACGPAPEVTLPAPAPHEPVTPGALQAAFGRSDITPPPGLGLAGNGPEGKQARGWRTRLYARALLLQDGRGERLALVTADLPHVSALLQRRVAQRLERDGLHISADNLLLSATHTHSAPGHFYEATEYNRSTSSISGYDERVTSFLVAQVAAAVEQAAGRFRPARLAWGRRAVWGLTRNRSYEAFRRNTPRWELEPPPPGLDPVYAAVNPIWTMLRVDLAVDAAGDVYRPAGAFSVFAIHGTGNSAENELFDGDVHALAERGLEHYIDQRYGGSDPPDPLAPPRAIHLVANGAHGDVSPDWPAQSRCALPQLEPVRRPEGPGTPMAWDWRRPTPAARAACIGSARRFIKDIGDSLTRHAIALFESLGDSLSDHADLAVGFETLALHRDAKRLGICPDPVVGTSTAAGAEDSRSRFAGWKFLGLLGIGLEEGGKAIDSDPKGCQGYKRTNLAPFALKHGLPEFAQLSVVRIGSMYLATVPAEPTTMAAAAIQRSVGSALGYDWSAARRRVLVVSLTNGFMQYVTTRGEYSAQAYEGGSTIYGPAEGEMLARELGRLADSLRRTGDGGSLPNRVDPIIGRPGADARLWPRAEGPDPATIPPSPVWVHCAADSVRGRWLGPSPGRLDLAGRPQVALEREQGGTWVPITWDDDPDVEIWLLGKDGSRGWRYEVRWSAPPAGVSLRFRVLGETPGTASSAPCEPAASQNR
jgi:neutral ceramidase